jgi:S1-C subfamily serine protease
MRHPIVLLLALAVVWLAACATPAPEAVEKPAQAIDAASSASTPAATKTLADALAVRTAPTEGSTPTPADAQLAASATATATTTFLALDPSEVFDRVSPSVAFIETAIGRGSGVLIEDNYIVTNAHVVQPFDQVRVVFPNGQEFLDTPVVALDLLGDLAVLGPVETTLAPAEFEQDEDLVVGRNVYLIGYPGEVERFPQPTISRGLVARKRQWPTIDMTYLQTDAKIAGGQSGGVLVGESGRVVGISGSTFGGAEFGLAASARDVQRRVRQLIDGNLADGPGRRPEMQADQAAQRFLINLVDDLATRLYVIREPVGSKVEITVETEGDLGILVQDAAGYLIELANRSAEGDETISFDIELDAPYYVKIFPNRNAVAVATVKSNVPMIPVIDPDDRRQPEFGSTIAASIDYPRDLDVYRIALDEGEVIHVRVESIMVDTRVWVDMETNAADDGIAPLDDNTGRGLFGFDPELVYRAPEAGTYLIIVETSATDDLSVGGYLLSVAEPSAAAPTPMAPAPTPVPIVSDFGDMTTYNSLSAAGFSIQYPAYWVNQSFDAGYERLCRLVTLCRFDYETNQVMVLAESQLTGLGPGRITQQRYIDVVLGDLENEAGVDILRRETVTSADGSEVAIIEYTLDNGLLHMTEIIHVVADVALRATIITPGPASAEDDQVRQYTEELIAYTAALSQYMASTVTVAQR